MTEQLATCQMIESKLYFFFKFYWGIVDLQCCVSFRCTAKWISYTYIHSCFRLFSHIGHYRVLSSLCCIVGPLLFMCPMLCKLMDCSPLGSSIHRILQARTLAWVDISFSRDFIYSSLYISVPISQSICPSWVFDLSYWKNCKNRAVFKQGEGKLKMSMFGEGRWVAQFWICQVWGLY